MGATGLSRSILLMLLSIVALPAFAEPPRIAGLIVPACAPPALGTALRAELAADGVQTVIYPSAAAIQDPKLPILTVELACDTPSFVMIRVDAPQTGRFAVRRISVKGANLSTQYRLAALTLAELVREKWPELSGQVTPEPVPLHLPAGDPPVFVQLAGVVRSFPRFGTTLFGAALRLGQGRLRGELSMVAGNTSDSLGEVAERLATLGVEALLLEYVFGRWRLECVGRATTGWAWATSQSDTGDAANADAVFAELAAGAGLYWAPIPSLEFSADLAPGFSRGLKLKADDTVISEIGGLGLSGQVGVRYAF